MANRSYLYTRHSGDKVEFRDIAEWKNDIPVAHLILVGADPTPCKSEIFTVDEKIAIEGDANITRPIFLKFLEWLKPQVDDSFGNTANIAQEYLTRDDRQGDKFHLEPGEIYDLSGLELQEMENETTDNASLAEALFSEVKRVLDIDGSTTASFEHELLKSITNWDEQFGCYFSQVLYFNLESRDNSPSVKFSFEIHDFINDKRSELFKAAENFLEEEGIVNGEVLVDCLGKTGFICGYTISPIIIDKPSGWVSDVAKRWKDMAERVNGQQCRASVDIEYF